MPKKMDICDDKINETKLEKVKNIVCEHYDEAEHGIFDNRNWAGDPMDTLYEDDELTVDICREYSYFEVFGLTNEEFKELEKYYNSLRKRGE